MSNRIKFNDDLGQHMTPSRIARMVCRELPRRFDIAVDYSVGHGDLLAPLRDRWPGITLHGIDCDQSRLDRAAHTLGIKSVSLGDGATLPLPAAVTRASGDFLAILNPPFVPMPSGAHRNLVVNAFPGVRSKHGLRRLEIAFLARALVDARDRKGWVAVILPSAFCAGLQYESYRKELLENYRVVKAIEIVGGRYRDTEASTNLLIIDASGGKSTSVRIAKYDTDADAMHVVYDGPVRSDQRLDATYWSASHLHNAPILTLGQVGVDIARGVRSRAEAARDKHWLLHTTDLARHRGRRIRLHEGKSRAFADVFAERGDILLPRTGTRVRWEAVEVADGRAPISDHLLRIRAPRGYRSVIRQSFRHPDFHTWLKSISKGVCATVLTKRELLNMPLFALDR
jgi:hypothetical protein